MHAASRGTATPSGQGFGAPRADLPEDARRPNGTLPAIALGPAADIDPLDPAVLLRRTSSGRRFDGRPVRVDGVSAVLSHAVEALRRLRRVSGGLLGQDVELHCAAHRVEGVPRGWYRYDHRGARLVASGIGTGDDSALVLQRAQLADSINIELAAFTVHVTAPVDFLARGRGVRGYREQQLAVGAAVDALALAATAAGLGSHPVLGFDAGTVDRAYGLPAGTGAHAQISVGLTRPVVNWEISVVPDER
ncbi:nitroreductase family protein [Actinokineospora soli]|uniref:Nitroreductase family protein n=1 Tax=Actinokineospora soli TaxID=1048753 RepID=A0ABW2TP74_9PSEU